ncbi:caspase-8 [Centroberyx affinis]|uniref:caspase-8 n=1 Tax=Centroberyx affinis TaxID=166261 RepID=UPI003A5C0746
MDLFKLSRIDEELESSEVAALCFLCRDVLERKRLETIKDGKQLFMRLDEKGLMENHVFLSQLLDTIRRADLLSLLETDSSRPEESFGPQTDANPVLSDYRVMLYRIHEDTTEENVRKMKFLLGGELGRGQMESCTTALDVFAEMERTGLLSSMELDKLHAMLLECDSQLAQTIQRYREGFQHQPRPASHFSMDNQRLISAPQPLQHSLSVSETRPSCEPALPSVEEQSLFSDSEPSTVSPSLQDQMEYYTLTHNPRGVCMIINNEQFVGSELRDRPGTQEDENALNTMFSRLGFEVVVRKDMTADEIRRELAQLGEQDFLEADALVVCVLSHGEMGCVFGTDEGKVTLRELTQPFTGRYAPTLAGKPKLFFIQACQGSGYQRGAMPCPARPRQGEGAGGRRSSLEEDAGPVQAESVPWDADFLVGMATVPECKSFRHTSMGSIYIQELCRQLERSAARQEDILNTLTCVNREVSKGNFMNYKQMPEPKYTLTKKLVLNFV